MTEFRKVTRDEFFAVIGPMNVHPNSARDVTMWETPARTVIGKSTPGYADPGPHKEWFLAGANRAGA